MTMKTLAQELAEQSIALLKNDSGTLPLPEGQKIAVLGRAQIKTVFSGNGSGASRGQGATILEALEQTGLRLFPALAAFYRKEAEADVEQGIDWELLAKTGNSGLAYELFGQYRAPAEEYPVPEKLLEEAGRYTDSAILVLGRSSGGEECDRRYENDYTLTLSEKHLVDMACGAFSKVVLVLNINGLIDLGWLEERPNIQSVIFLGIPGEDGAAALAEILTGQVNPSGRLGFTIARRYEDYPSAREFSWDKDTPLCYEDYGLDPAANGSVGFAKSPVTVYREGVFNGYRYFDAFGIEPLFPFGHGLSYTRFETAVISIQKGSDALEAVVRVKNTGSFSGREAVLLYQRGNLKKLWGFEKTELLAPGAEQLLTIRLPYRDLAVYDEDKAAWVIERGTVQIELQDGQRVGTISIPEPVPVRQCENLLPLRNCNRGKIDFLCPAAQSETVGSGTIELHSSDIMPDTPPRPPESRKAVFSDFSVQELAALCVGYGPGIPFSALSREKLPETVCDENGTPLTVNDHPTGTNGYVSPAMPGRGIHSVYYKDGPAGIGRVAWPAEMLLACSFDRKLLYRFGDAVGAECEEAGCDVWLAPAVNLHRNPLCGRNFEYFSEDPLLTGSLAVAAAQGVQERHPVLVCPKHFAANEQEICRRGSAKRNYDAADSIIEEKALRELYLKPFEMLVKEAHIACVMTSFNKINGIFAGGNHDLCTRLLREEWGFRGCVVTDWGDMDTVVDGADAIAAGNDVVMPGGPPVIAQILRGFDEGRVTRETLETDVGHLMEMLERTSR